MDRNYNTRGTDAADQRDRRDWRAAAIRLWQLLDDLDTADDVARADDVKYRQIAKRLQQERFSIIGGDEFDRVRDEIGIEATHCEDVIRRGLGSASAPSEEKAKEAAKQNEENA